MFDAEKAILVWKFHEAPDELKALSDNGGDEDWLALIPRHLKDAYIPWLEVGPFGVCDVNQYESEYGMGYIGVHA